MKTILVVATVVLSSCQNLQLRYEDEKGVLSYENNTLTIRPNPIFINPDK